MLGAVPKPAIATAIEPRPVHNQSGTIFSLARQILADLDRNAIDVRLPTATVELLLTVLCDMMVRSSPTTAQRQGAMAGAMSEAMTPAKNPNSLRLWRPDGDSDDTE